MPQLSKEVLALKTESDVRAYFAKLLQEIRAGSQSEQGGGGMMMARARGRPAGAMIRASELPSPAPRDHFLYVFGASDREVVDAASRVPNVGQVLALMNGFVQDHLVNNSGAHLYQSLKGATTESEKIRRLHIAILSRPPTDQEMSWMLDEIKSCGPDDGCRNIVSALVMSSEFLFLQ